MSAWFRVEALICRWVAEMGQETLDLRRPWYTM